MEFKLLFINLVVLCCCSGGSGFDIANQTKLRVDLLGLYNRRVRPEAVTTVNLIFNLLTINALDTRTQSLSVSGFFTYVWSDKRLQWNKADYNGIGFIFSDQTELWRPALVLKNAVNNLDVIANDQIPFRVLHTGTVFWNPPGIFVVNCELDTTYYPFDTQSCTMSIQSWGYNLRELDLIKYGSGVETGEFTPNGEWNLLEAYSQRAEKVSSVEVETYASVAFIFRLQRRSEYYGINIILPVVVLSVLSSLVFMLPADSGEKMGFSLTVLLAFAVFLTLIADRMPSTSTYTSYMAVYLAVILILSGLSIFLTVMVLDFHFRETEVPKYMENFIRHILQPILCMHGCKNTASATVTHSNTADGIKEKAFKKTNSKIDPDEVDWSERTKTPSDVGEMTWKEVSRTLDVLFFRMYIIMIILVTIIFFSVLAVGSNSAAELVNSGSSNTTNSTA